MPVPAPAARRLEGSADPGGDKVSALHRSVEEGCLVSVIEENPRDAAWRLTECMLDGELTEFHGQVSQLLDLINAEVSRRGLK